MREENSIEQTKLDEIVPCFLSSMPYIPMYTYMICDYKGMEQAHNCPFQTTLQRDKNPLHFKTDDVGLIVLSMMMELFYNLSFLKRKPYMTNEHLKYR